MGTPPQGLRFCAPWPRGEQSTPKLSAWRIDRMEGLEGGQSGGAGLMRFLLQFDPGNARLDRTLLCFSLSALFSRLLGWSKSGGQREGSKSITGKEGGDPAAAAAVSVAALAAAVSLCLAATYASDQRPRHARRRWRLSASALAGRNSARSRALPAPDDGLRFLSSNDASLENVIHGASIGAEDEEPFIVARVEMQPTDIAGANAGDKSEEERRELERLRELWLSLLEREQRLELRLQELDGLREQEATVRELESRVAASAMKARLLELKVFSLQEENVRLRAQEAELDAARAELARAKEKVRAIKARVQGEQEEARREAAALRATVAELERGGEERASALAAEVASLRKANAVLGEENMELGLRLRDAEQAASSVNLILEEDIAEETNYLRETNERLTRQIEQLRSDHCAHVEELVYLKWVNACLRHELCDHGLHPPPSSTHQEQEADHDDGSAVAGGMSAVDLSKSMSFRSSERAKQLMLRYGHPGLDAGFDPALFSPLNESVDGDGDKRAHARSYEHEPSPAGTSVTTTTMAASAVAPAKRARPRKSKFLVNIKKLLQGGRRGQSSHGHGHAGRESRKAPAPSDEYLEKAMQWLSTHDVLDGDHSYESTPLSSCARTPLCSVTTVTDRCDGGSSERGEDEAPPALARSKSDAGASYGREASPYHMLRPDHPAEEALRGAEDAGGGEANARTGDSACRVMLNGK